jgi:Ca-activated chloride channel family protein
MDQLLEGVSEEKVKKEVTGVALEHHLVSQYTSLVAVEQVQSKPQAEESGTEKLPQNLPHGWEMNQTPVSIPGAGTEMVLFLFLGVLLITAALTLLVVRKKQC